MFNLEEFVANPSVGALTALHKKDWASLAIYYELEPRPTLTKSQLQKLVLEHLMEEEVLDRNEVQDHFSLSSGDTEEARNKLPLTQSSFKVNPNPSGPREPAALSPLQGRPRFAPMNSGSVSPDDSLQPSHSVTILRDSGSMRTFVLREAISSFPQCQTGYSLVVRGLFSKDQEPSEVSPACVVTRSNSHRLVKDSLSVPQVANPPPENNIVSDFSNPEFSLDEFFNSASQESNVPDQTSSSEPVIRSITDMAVTRTTLIAEQAKDPSLRICFDHAVNEYNSREMVVSELTAESQCLVVTSSPDVEESDITKCSHLVVPNDNEEERADAVVEPVLQNSEVLKNPGEKLAHLQEEQAASIVHLLQEHVALFSDSPSRCPLLHHDVDVQASHPMEIARAHFAQLKLRQLEGLTVLI
ncbi:hypothetical protein Pcinc_008873 [Petrolisthes cinctipes]|uniref:Uncharacterized protein n=1 Tax=Petrolisthes cinctipes TaxID=88211 RepID=A0AAE1G7Y6_PETCI|nr:hypothetical protein Pcinc_008873 [Petrolisthes cinctipes]